MKGERSSRWRWVLVTAGIVALVVVWQAARSRPNGNTEADASTPGACRVSRVDLHEELRVPATVRPSVRTAMRSPVAGRVDSLFVAEGAAVTNGQLVGWVSSVERLAMLDAARGRSEAERAKWDDLVRPVPLMAPVGGTVLWRRAAPGQPVAPDTDIVVLYDRLVTVAQVDEADVSRLRPGIPVSASMPAFPGVVLTGTVARVSNEASLVNGVPMFDVEVLCAGLPPAARAGMSVDCRLILSVRKGVLALPAEVADGFELPGQAVVADAAGRVSARSVQTGIRSGGWVEIVSGLSEGEAVVRKHRAGAGGVRTTSPIVPISQRSEGR